MRSYLAMFLYFLLLSALCGALMPSMVPFQSLALLGHMFGLLAIFIAAYELQKKAPKSSLFCTLFSGLWVKNCIQFSWLLSHPYFYMIAVWILVSGILALPIAFLFVLFVRAYKRSKCPYLLSMAVSFMAVVVEILVSYTFPPISFSSAALVLTWSEYGIQMASLLGRELLSFLVFFASFLGFHFWKSVREGRRWWPFSGMLWVFFLAAPYLYGYVRVSSYTSAEKEIVPVKIAICHMEETPDIFELGETSPWGFATNEWKKVLTTLQPLFSRNTTVDLVVVPEGAIPYPGDAFLVECDMVLQKVPGISQLLIGRDVQYYPQAYTTSIDTVQALASRVGAPFLIGLEGRDHEEDATKVYNSAYFFRPHGGGELLRQMRYDKQLLIPFGEYVPWDWMADILRRYGVHGSFRPGSASKVFPLPYRIGNERCEIPFSPLICYEETFSRYGLRCRLAGAACIVSLSNDSWFPSHVLKWVHFDLARLQAVELGIPIVRATNMGVSGAIDMYGRLLLSYEGREERDNRLLMVTVPISIAPTKTLYTQLYSAF